MLNQPIIFINNLLAKLRFAKAEPENALLLLPHCLQNRECKVDLIAGIENCERCGKCKISKLIDLSKEFGLRAVVVNGGRQALIEVRNGAVKTVIAVACEQELASGIKALPFKKIYAVPNIINGQPCINTGVSIRKVHEVLVKAVKQEK